MAGRSTGSWHSRLGLNIEALEKVTGLTFTAAEEEEITTKTRRAWRWTFLVSGLEHPNVVKTIGELTTLGPGKIKGVAGSALGLASHVLPNPRLGDTVLTSL